MKKTAPNQGIEHLDDILADFNLALIVEDSGKIERISGKRSLMPPQAFSSSPSSRTIFTGKTLNDIYESATPTGQTCVETTIPITFKNDATIFCYGRILTRHGKIFALLSNHSTRLTKLTIFERVFNDLPTPVKIFTQSSTIYSNKAYQSLEKSAIPKDARWSESPRFEAIPCNTKVPYDSLISATTKDAKPTQVRASSFRDKHLAVTAYHDVTNEKLLEKAVSNYKQFADDRNYFIGVLGHELRTPVNFLYSGLRRLKQSSEHNSENAHLLDRLVTKTQELSTLMENLLSLSRQQAGMFKLNTSKANPSRIVQDAIDALEHQRPDSIQIRSRIQRRIPPVLADAIRIQEALINLLSNALKYSGTGGTVTIDCRTTEHRDAVNITISDNGPGMTTKQIEAAMAPFSRVQSNPGLQSGTGIGLTVAAKIAELHGAPLQVRSRVGHGTSITLKLLTLNDSPKEGEVTFQTDYHQTKWPTTFLVDIDSSATQTLSQYLEAIRIPHSSYSPTPTPTSATDKEALYIVSSYDSSPAMNERIESHVCDLARIGVKNIVVHATTDPSQRSDCNILKFVQCSSCLANLVDIIKQGAGEM